MKAYLSVLLSGALIFGASLLAFGQATHRSHSSSHHQSSGSHHSVNSGSKTHSNIPKN